jgi:DNA-binding CsgD family transcriptional regulator
MFIMVTDENGEVWLTPKEAAIHLGISTSRVYHLKNKLTHKKGSQKQSRIFFLKSTIFDDYIGR